MLPAYLDSCGLHICGCLFDPVFLALVSLLCEQTFFLLCCSSLVFSVFSSLENVSLPSLLMRVCVGNVLNSRLTAGNKTYQKRGWRRGGVDCLVSLGMKRQIDRSGLSSWRTMSRVYLLWLSWEEQCCSSVSGDPLTSTLLLLLKGK